jgi:YfiR/HmsC-like
VLAVFAVTAATPRLSAQSRAEEYQVKAAFLFHFAQFVEWPEAVFKSDTSPLTYCTIGEDPFQGALDASLNGKMIGARSIRVQHLKPAQEISECHILFIGAIEKRHLSTVLAGIKGTPVLTVGDSEHFVTQGGVIGFCLEEKKIRFEINLDAATEARLRISARLLALAKTVIGDPRAN